MAYNAAVRRGHSLLQRGDHPSLRAAVIDAIRDELLNGMLPPVSVSA